MTILATLFLVNYSARVMFWDSGPKILCTYQFWAMRLACTPKSCSRSLRLPVLLLSGDSQIVYIIVEDSTRS